MNKHVVIVGCLLCSAPILQGMKKEDKNNNQYFKVDQKTKVRNLDDDLKKLKEEQQQYRSKHKVLKDEPNNVRLDAGEKK